MVVLFWIVVGLFWLLVLLGGGAFCTLKLAELYEFVRRRQDEARLRARITELEAALARATEGGVYRAPAVPSPGPSSTAQ